jgi:hypothetical protein
LDGFGIEQWHKALWHYMAVEVQKYRPFERRPAAVYPPLTICWVLSHKPLLNGLWQ